MISDKSLKSVSNDHKALLSGCLGLKSFGFLLACVFSRVLVLNGSLPLASLVLLATTLGRGSESAAKLRFFCGVGRASDLPALDIFAECNDADDPGRSRNPSKPLSFSLRLNLSNSERL